MTDHRQSAETLQAKIREVPAMLLLWFGLGLSLAPAASEIVGPAVVQWVGIGFMAIAAVTIWLDLGMAINEL